MKRVVEVLAIGAKVNIMSTSIPAWASEVAEFLDEEKLSKTKKEAWKIQKRVTMFLLIDEILYRRGFFTLLLRCISVQET